MVNEPTLPKDITNQLKPKKPKDLKEHEFIVSPHFYKKNDLLKFVRIYIPTGIVNELNLREGNSLELRIDIDKSNKDKIVIMRVKK